MSRYLHYNNADITNVLKWAEEQGPHNFIGLYQASLDWLVVIEPLKTGKLTPELTKQLSEEFEPPKKRKVRPKGWKKGDPYV